MWLGRKSDGKGAIEVFALCLQETLGRALVGGTMITVSLTAAAFGKFPGKGLGKLEPPAELAAATTLSEAGCLFVRILVPGEVFHLGRLFLPAYPCAGVRSVACNCTSRRACTYLYGRLRVCAHLSIYLYGRAYFLSLHP